MKFRHLLTGSILTISILAAASATSMAAVTVTKGRFDTVDDTAVTGWAFNSESPNHPLNVWITIKNKNTGEEILSQRVVADEYREDLYKKCMGDGRHGFTLNIDWSAYPEGVYLVEGSVGDRIFPNPRTYTNDAPHAPEAQATAAVQSGNLIPLGVFKTTAYCPCKSCSGGWGRHTSTGAVATAGRTIAVDPRVIPYGSRVMINGVIYTAEDRGGGVKGNHIDIFFNSHEETRWHGAQKTEVFLVQ